MFLIFGSENLVQQLTAAVLAMRDCRSLSKAQKMLWKQVTEEVLCSNFCVLCVTEQMELVRSKFFFASHFTFFALILCFSDSAALAEHFKHQQCYVSQLCCKQELIPQKHCKLNL